MTTTNEPWVPPGKLLESRLRELAANKQKLDRLAQMLKPNETVIHEPTGIETLDLQPAYRHHWNEKEYVRVGVPEPGDFVSLVIVHFDEAWRVQTLQAVLTVEEVDAVIEGLQEAKRRVQGEP